MKDSRFKIQNLRFNKKRTQVVRSDFLSTQRVGDKISIFNLSKGFTIVEFLIYMGIFSVLLTVLFSMFGAILDTRSESETFSATQQDGNYITSRLNYDVTRATKVTIPASLGATSSSLQIVINGANYTYALDGSGNLQLTNASGTFNLNSYGTTVSNFSVTRYGNIGGVEDILQISFKLISTTKANSTSDIKTMQETISLRRN